MCQVFSPHVFFTKKIINLSFTIKATNTTWKATRESAKHCDLYIILYRKRLTLKKHGAVETVCYNVAKISARKLK